MKKTSSAILAAGIASSMLLGTQAFAADPVAAPAKADAKAVAAPAAKVDNWAFLPEIVAEVDGKKITKAEVIKIVEEQLAKSQFASMLNADTYKKLAPRLVASMVETEVLLKLAAAKGYVPSEKLASESFDVMLKSIPKDKMEMVEKQLAAQNKTLKSVREEMIKDKSAQDQAAIRTWITKEIEPGIKVSDLEVSSFYESNKDKFKSPAKVKASHILIKPKDESEAAKKAAKDQAEKLLADIKAGKITFEAAAEKYSACPSGKQKGSLGEFGRGDMVPEFDTTVFALKNGELSGVVATQFGFHIIRKDGEKAEKVFTLNEKAEGQDITVKESLEKYLRNQKVQKAIADQLDTGKKAFKVQIFLKDEEPVAAAPVKK